MNIAIVGGGIMGITLAYYLSKAGAQVEIFEASPVLGGLAGPMTLPEGTEVDRFYHAILSSDAHLNELCGELGIADQMRFKETKTGFYFDNRIYSMNNVIEFLKFPPLSMVDRVRLGVTVLNAQRVSDWHELEGVSVEDWLLKWSGPGTYKNIWRPMLKAKFDGDFSNVPATWMWSRLVRVKSTRQGASQKEMAGHIIGGYITLIKAMAERIEAAGGKIHLKTPVQEVVIEKTAQGERATGLKVNGQYKSYDAVAVTSQTPIFRKLIPNASKAYHDFLGKTDYLGIVCPLMVLDKPLTGYWTLNITDDRVPFTGVIETTTFIDPKYVGGHHLVYLPKYTAPGSDWLNKTDAEIKQVWLDNLKSMFPDFNPQSIRYFLVHRERYVEPLHGLNSTDLIPTVKTPVDNLYLVTTAQIYPALTNGESVSRHGHEAADLIRSSVRPGVAVPQPQLEAA
jgi:protoporphyrinogen oxidase